VIPETLGEILKPYIEIKPQIIPCYFSYNWLATMSVEAALMVWQHQLNSN